MNSSESSVSNIMVARGLDNSTDNTRMAHWFNPKPNPIPMGVGGGGSATIIIIKTKSIQKQKKKKKKARQNDKKNEKKGNFFKLHIEGQQAIYIIGNIQFLLNIKYIMG